MKTFARIRRKLALLPAVVTLTASVLVPVFMVGHLAFERADVVAGLRSGAASRFWMERARHLVKYGQSGAEKYDVSGSESELLAEVARFSDEVGTILESYDLEADRIDVAATVNEYSRRVATLNQRFPRTLLSMQHQHRKASDKYGSALSVWSSRKDSVMEAYGLMISSLRSEIDGLDTYTGSADLSTDSVNNLFFNMRDGNFHVNVSLICVTVEGGQQFYRLGCWYRLRQRQPAFGAVSLVRNSSPDQQLAFWDVALPEVDAE